MASASLSYIVNVSLLEAGRQIARDNMNVVTLMTSQLGTLSSSNRYGIYRTASAVAADFGTNSDVYSHALAFFSTSPNPANSGGYLVIGYWRAAEETVAAIAASLTGPQLVAETVIGQLQTISDGSFDIDIDGTTEEISGLDFRTTTELSDIVTLLNDELSGGTASLSTDGLSIVITSDTTGASSTITNTSEGSTGTYVGSLLGLGLGDGNGLVQGAAADTLAAETKLAAVTELKNQVNFKALVFIAKPVDADVTALSAWAKANNVIMYDVFSSPDNLEVAVSNVVWSNKLASGKNYRCIYSKVNNRKLATSYMARNHTVNFGAENSAITMNLKELSQVAESYTDTEITKAQRVGLDIYTTSKDVPKLLTSGANDFTDNVYNSIALVDAVQTDVFNVLGSTSTKIAQTKKGVKVLIDQCEKTSRGFARSNVIGAGTWTSSDSFGDLATFKRNISENGFYWLAQSLADQPQSEREARKSPVLQGAVKYAGAIHSVDIIINLNL